MGIEVHLVPTWAISDEWRRKVQAIGCEIHEIAGPDLILDVPGIKESIVVGMCNAEFLKCTEVLRAQARCKLVWMNCMCWIFDREVEHYRKWGPFHRYVFQSEFQKSCLFPLLHHHGLESEAASVIHGAFFVDEWPYAARPHARDTEFYIGRLSRVDADKFSSNSWKIYGAIPYRLRRIRVMGWDPQKMEPKAGKAPPWAEVLPANYVTPQAFMSGLHCYMQINGGAKENWPRAGLEAMATGVPIVAQDEWGWREMIEHGKTGFLAKNDEELAYYAAQLAYDEELRQTMAKNAMYRARKLSDPDMLASQWKAVLEGL
jgi:hypothetical protein